MPELTPLDDNRQEHFLNGEDLEPITRREHFYAGRESELPAGHQEPETREEWFIKKYRGGGGGDITVESLSVTSNGTYTAPSGKAYSPVNVNVPLPQNAYLLKSVTTPTPIASFTDGEEMVMPTLKVAIEPQQEGSGDPSPTNIRPISGWSEADVTRTGKNLFDKSNQEDGWYYGGNVIGSVATIQTGSTLYAWHKDMFIKGGNTYTLSFRMTGDKTIRPAYVLCDSNMIVLSTQYWSLEVKEKTFTITPTEDGYLSICTPNKNSWDDCNIQLEEGSVATEYEPYNGNTYTIDLDGTRYGGELDVVNGVLTVDRVGVDLGTLTYSKSASGLFQTSSVASAIRRPTSTTSPTGFIISSIYKEISGSSISGPQGANPSPDGVMGLSSNGVMYFNYLAVTAVEDFVSAMNGQTFCYELATPLTIQLTPTAVKSLEGINNLFADCGQVQELSYFSKEV